LTCLKMRRLFHLATSSGHRLEFLEATTPRHLLLLTFQPRDGGLENGSSNLPVSKRSFSCLCAIKLTSGSQAACLVCTDVKPLTFGPHLPGICSLTPRDRPWTHSPSQRLRDPWRVFVAKRSWEFERSKTAGPTRLGASPPSLQNVAPSEPPLSCCQTTMHEQQKLTGAESSLQPSYLELIGDDGMVTEALNDIICSCSMGIADLTCEIAAIQRNTNSNGALNSVGRAGFVFDESRLKDLAQSFRGQSGALNTHCKLPFKGKRWENVG